MPECSNCKQMLIPLTEYNLAGATLCLDCYQVRLNPGVGPRRGTIHIAKPITDDELLEEDGK